MKLLRAKFRRWKRRWLFTQQMVGMQSTLPKEKKKFKNLHGIKGIFDTSQVIKQTISASESSSADTGWPREYYGSISAHAF